MRDGLLYACQEDKLEVCISCLESRIESLQGIAVVFLQGYFGTLKGYLVVKIHHIKERLVGMPVRTSTRKRITSASSMASST